MSEESEVEVSLSLTEQWNHRSVVATASLQKDLSDYEFWIINASVVSDPKEMFTFFFPLFVGLWNELGARTLWAAIFVEWSNLILKWLLKGDRPYWWIGETSFYSDLTRPVLKQFPNTCESGPGTPSGHITMNVAVFYVVLRGISKHYVWGSRKLSIIEKWLINATLIMAYITWITLVFVSRLYIQAHFIHQCFLGMLAGLIVGHIAWSSDRLMKPSKVQAVLIANCLVVTTVIMYVVLLYQEFNPLWSIPLAEKYCTTPGGVKVETQPFYLIVRFAGAALGLGMGLAAEQRKVVVNAPSHLIRSVLGMKGGMFIGRVATLVQATLPKDDMVLYLTLTLSVHAVSAFTIIALFPHFLISIYPPN